MQKKLKRKAKSDKNQEEILSEEGERKGDGIREEHTAAFKGNFTYIYM